MGAWHPLFDRHLFDGKLGGIKKRMLRSSLQNALEEELSGVRRQAREAFKARSGG